MPSAIFTQIIFVIFLVIEFYCYFCNDKYYYLFYQIISIFVA